MEVQSFYFSDLLLIFGTLNSHLGIGVMFVLLMLRTWFQLRTLILNNGYVGPPTQQIIKMA
jgi:uncharacterized membrane protein